MKKILLVAAAGMFALSSCTDCKTCNCTVTDVSVYTSQGQSSTNTDVRNVNETFCISDANNDLKYYESNPVIETSTSDAVAGTSSSSSVTWDCDCKK